MNFYYFKRTNIWINLDLVSTIEFMVGGLVLRTSDAERALLLVHNSEDIAEFAEWLKANTK